MGRCCEAADCTMEVHSSITLFAKGKRLTLQVCEAHFILLGQLAREVEEERRRARPRRTAL